jgi:hypothetical protein
MIRAVHGATTVNASDFSAVFRALTTHARFRWQWALLRRFCSESFPASCHLPTGIGKTSVIPLWLLALAENPAVVPRRVPQLPGLTCDNVCRIRKFFLRSIAA